MCGFQLDYRVAAQLECENFAKKRSKERGIQNKTKNKWKKWKQWQRRVGKREGGREEVSFVWLISLDESRE